MQKHILDSKMTLYWSHILVWGYLWYSGGLAAQAPLSLPLSETTKPRGRLRGVSNTNHQKVNAVSIGGSTCIRAGRAVDRHSGCPRWSVLRLPAPPSAATAGGRGRGEVGLAVAGLRPPAGIHGRPARKFVCKTHLSYFSRSRRHRCSSTVCRSARSGLHAASCGPVAR